MSVKNIKKPEKLVQSAAVSYRKSSTWAQMIDIDALDKKPMRSNFFHVYRWKIKKTTQNLAKLAPKIRKVSKKQRCLLQKRLYIGSNDRYWFDALIKTWYKGFLFVFLLHDCWWKIKITPHIGTDKLLLYIYELPNDNANLRKSESIFETMSSSFASQFSIFTAPTRPSTRAMSGSPPRGIRK